VTHLQTADQLVINLYENGWKPSRKFPDTGKWRFLEIRGLVLWGVICVVEESPASIDEIKNIASYIKQFMPIISMGGIDLVVIFSQAPFYTDLSNCPSKFRLVSINKIIQFTPEKVYALNKSTAGLFDKNLEGIVLLLAGSREIVLTRKNEKVNKNQHWKMIALYSIVFVVIMYFLQRFQTPRSESILTSQTNALIQQGDDQYKKGNYDAAIKDYSEGIKLQPDIPKAYSRRGFTYFSKGDFAQAILDFNKALELNPKDAKTYYRRGNAFVHNRLDLEHAIPDFTQATQLDPKDPWGFYGLGVSYSLKRDFNKALSDLTRAIELNPHFAEAYNSRAEAYVGEDNYDQAISDFTQAIKYGTSSDSISPYLGRGECFACKGDEDRAISDFKMAIKTNPKDDVAKSYLRDALAQKKGKK